MGLLHAVKKFFASPPLFVRLSDIEAGRAIVEGEVRTGTGGHLQSPLKGKPCVAFFYTATTEVSVRGGKTTRPLRSVEGFHPFGLELADGRLEATPRTPGSFTQHDHQQLAANGYPGFRADEEIVAPRSRVRLHGVIRRDGDGWAMTYQRIVVLGGKKKK